MTELNSYNMVFIKLKINCKKNIKKSYKLVQYSKVTYQCSKIDFNTFSTMKINF